MTLGRPCQRCIKRSIGHLCHDEVKTSGSTPSSATASNKIINGSSAANGNSPAAAAPVAVTAVTAVAANKPSVSSYMDTSSTSIPVVPQHLVGKSSLIQPDLSKY